MKLRKKRKKAEEEKEEEEKVTVFSSNTGVHAIPSVVTILDTKIEHAFSQKRSDTMTMTLLVQKPQKLVQLLNVCTVALRLHLRLLLRTVFSSVAHTDTEKTHRKYTLSLPCELFPKSAKLVRFVPTASCNLIKTATISFYLFPSHQS